MAEERISVSEDKLYRALGELELRLVKHITDALAHKADAVTVEDLRSRVGTLEASRIARAHLEVDVKDHSTRIDNLESADRDRKVSLKAIKVAVVGGALGALGFVSEIFVAIYYGKHLFH